MTHTSNSCDSRAFLTHCYLWNKMLEFWNTCILLENVFISFSLFQCKLIYFFIIIQFRFSFEKLFDAREFFELVAGSSWNTLKSFQINASVKQSKCLIEHLFENEPKATIKRDISQSHIITNKIASLGKVWMKFQEFFNNKEFICFFSNSR